MYGQSGGSPVLRAAVMQGPPGTGKTFVGVKLCEILVRLTQERILCVCYTNHALDQFLEALLEQVTLHFVLSQFSPWFLFELLEEHHGVYCRCAPKPS